MHLIPLLLLASFAVPTQEPKGSSAWDGLANGESLQVEQVLFILNEEVITLSMVQERGARILRTNKTVSDQQALSQALADLVFDLIALEGFRRLGMDETLLEANVTQHVDRQILGAGSRARFESTLREDGFTMTSFRAYVKAELIKLTWRGVVTGAQPSPLQGTRARLDATPAEIRAEFDRDPERWKQGFELVWSTLQFHDSPTGSGLERAQTVADGLKAGTMTLDAAKAASQSSQASRGDPAARNYRPEILDFLLTAQAGDVSPVELIPSIGGLFLVVEKRSPAHVIGFAEAQLGIAAELKKRKAELVVGTAAEEILRTSYSWFPEALQTFMSGFYGKPVGPTETEF